MNIALDFDDTYTLDPELWGLFLKSCKTRNHNVYIVTMRGDTERNRSHIERALSIPTEIVFCGMKWKSEVCNHRGIKIDVWIDDLPFIIKDQSLIDVTLIGSVT